MKVRLGAISTFIKELKKIKAKNGYTLFFRGHSDENYVAVPSIFRHVDNDKKKDKYIINEDRLYKSMVANCPSDFHGCNSAFDHLVKMQHYGLPTRLLDITSNPLVALYFACCEHNGKGGSDGEVIIYEIPDEEIKFYSGDTVSVLSNLAKMPSTFDYKMEKDKFLHEIKYEKPYFIDGIKYSHLYTVFCVKPKLDNPRVIKQSGAFFLFGMGSSKIEPADIPDHFLFKVGGGSKTIKIALNGKATILEELKELGVSPASLFPEIEKVAEYLKKQPKGML
ncbi:FRG domain-containing protein [bacterium 19CA06SA08-2]|uniref:FRG domain-containing protein n=1 Tax=bacterium 19CA06SA08-2 TaxID=2920658 RepID=A0AAU6U8H3_UNCXX